MPMELIVCSDELIEKVIGAAIEVHRVLGISSTSNAGS